jgi:4a-hydroxytetrahydrobiopterin dehydratase
MRPPLLETHEIQTALATLPDWALDDLELVRVFKFSSYLAGIDFVNRISELAELAHHHPDLIVQWRKVTVKLTTHAAGGITSLDISLARQISCL